MHALALRAPTDENFIFLIGKGILQIAMQYCVSGSASN
jgi:hypothetical protein